MGYRVKDKVKDRVISGYKVPGVNDRGERIRGLCRSAGMSISSIYFKHKDTDTHSTDTGNTGYKRA